METRGTENEIQTSPPQLPPWIELPEDVTANILGRLGTEEILENAQKVCTTWWKVCKDPSMWRVVRLIKPNDNRDFNLMCRCAVDRSKGQLTVLSITHFGDDELLNYVVHRSIHLRFVFIANTNDVSASALVEVVKKLPQLEELHLHLISVRPFTKYVETVGIACPLLKSFTFNELWGAEEDDCNGIALAIAKTMPNLQHLRLAGDEMKNEGLEAILDGCPHLELLYLVNCTGVNLRGALGERCSKQIKSMTTRFLLPPSYDDMLHEYYESLDDDDCDSFDALLNSMLSDNSILFDGSDTVLSEGIMESFQSLGFNLP